MKRKILPLLLAICLCPLVAAPVQADTEAINVFVPVTCVAEGSEETFFYSMYPVEKDNPYKASPDVLELQDGDEDGFSLEIDYPGKYEYTVSQEKGSDENTTYDDTVYQATVFVTEDDAGELSVKTVLYAENRNGKSAECKFENIVNVPDKPEEPTETPEATPEVTPSEKPEQPDDTTTVIGPKTGLENNAAAFAAGGFLLLAITALFALKRRDDR